MQSPSRLQQFCEKEIGENGVINVGKTRTKRGNKLTKKSKGRIEIQPVFNPISYEKPIHLDIRGKDKVASVDKKIGPDRHRGRFNPIFYENQLLKVKIFASLPHQLALKPFW